MTDTAASRPDTADMAAVHNVFRTSLASCPELIAGATGDDERRALIANYLANVLSFLEVHHEGEEQLVFPLLAERAPEHRAAVERAERQHAEVSALLTAARESVAAWEAEGDAAAERATASLGALDRTLCAHLDEEEADIVPLARQYMTVEEWGMLPGHAMGSFQGDKVWLIMGLVRENFTPQQRAAMLEAMPPPARDMWQTMGEASFDEMIAQVRRVG
jgi:iron-sulfur cluster repair protein YtfE (RIC family)